MANQPSTGGQAINALKLVADVAIIPGASQLVEGNVGSGVTYGAVGVVAKMLSPMLGPLGWLPWLVAGLDSFSMSANGNHIWQLGGAQPQQPPAQSGPEIVKP